MKTLRELVEKEMDNHGETAADVEQIVVGGDSFRVNVDTQKVESLAGLEEYSGDTGYGGQRLPAIRLWTTDRVYFKATYDGSEWVTSLPREPTAEKDPESVGGG